MSTMLRPAPDWFDEWRPSQLEAVEAAVDQFSEGVGTVIADLPTGSGKTMFAVEVANRLDVAKPVYTCTTIQLQEQVLRDFEYAAVLKGRSRYVPSLVSSGGDITCDDCEWTPRLPACSWCRDHDTCPYQVARKRALGSPLPVLNLAYLLAELNGPGAFGGRELVIVDEADLVEKALMDFVEVKLSPRALADLGLEDPTRKTRKWAWVQWADGAIASVIGRLAELGEFDDHELDVATRRTKQRLGRLHGNLLRLRDDLEAEQDLWVYDPDVDGVCFRPVRVDHLAEAYLWGHAKRWLLMSATVLSSGQLASELGVVGYGEVSAPWTFPAKNRPVYIRPVCNMSMSSVAEDYPKVADAVGRVMEKHPDDRILVHCVSYKLATFLVSNLPTGRVMTYTASTRYQVLKKYLSTPGAVLVAPSMERGVDLPGDACRVQVVCKVPFPNKGDRQVERRIYTRGGNTWYTAQAIRSLVQATGRGIRSADDHATTYILDGQIMSLLSKSRHLFPQGWLDAVVTKGTGGI